MEASVSGQNPAQGAGGDRRLGLALVIIATAQLMVVLDATIVNVALPHIETALNFSGKNLEWVVNAYALAFGGLLLLGGRLGDLFGRRRMFIAGLIVFTAASLVGGLAQSQGWLLACRAVQGMGAAVVAPAALALISTTFPDGPPRNRALGVYAAMSVAGSVLGLIVGGILVTYVSWRWVLFVNVPIGALAVLAAPRVLDESSRLTGRFDLPGAVTGTVGVVALVYGLTNATTTPDGVSHWGDTKVVVSLAVAVIMLVAFVVVEIRSSRPLLPIHLLRNRDRSGAYLVMLFTGTGVFGMYFFLTLYLQQIWQYSALHTGVAYMPYAGAVIICSGLASQLVTKVGPRILLVLGALLTGAGLIWQSGITEHSTYVGAVLGPMLIGGAGLGLLFVPLTMVTLAGVPDDESGVASSVLNAGQQVGGSIGLAVLGTISFTLVADNLKLAPSQLTQAVERHAYSIGFARSFLWGGIAMLVAMVIAGVMIRLSAADLGGGVVAAAPAAAPVAHPPVETA
jgi:EmrB/QacA subfamily drug resistance transporter